MALLMKKTRRAKKFKVRMFYHLQNLFWGVFVQGFFALGGYVQGFLSGGLCLWGLSRGFCPDTIYACASSKNHVISCCRLHHDCGAYQLGCHDMHTEDGVATQYQKA